MVDPGRPETGEGVEFFVDAHVDLPYFMIHHGPESMLSEIDDAPFTLPKARQTGIGFFLRPFIVKTGSTGIPPFFIFNTYWMLP